MMFRPRPLTSAAAIAAVALAATGAMAQTTYPEVEPNSQKSVANARTLASGDAITGSTTGTTTSATSTALTTADYWRIKTVANPVPAIYRHEMVLTTTGTDAYTPSIRGLTQATVGVISATSDAVFASALVTPRTLAWYGFGREEEVYLSIAGTTATTGTYTMTMTDTTVAPTVAAGTLYAGGITVRTVKTLGTNLSKLDFWVYDSSFNPLTHDNPSGSGPAGYRGLQVTAGNPPDTLCSMLRTLPAGTYYLAVSGSNLGNNLASYPGDDAGQNVLDFPDAVSSSGNTVSPWAGYAQFADSFGNTVTSPELIFPSPWYNLVQWVRFTVVDLSAGECCDGAACTVVNQPDCAGAWSLGGSCTPGPCADPVGSCCTGGDCALAVAANCTGAWTSAGTCSPNACVARCCETSGTCTVVALADCPGSWLSSASSCSPNPCPQPTGACCNNLSGACSFIYTGACAAGTTATGGITCDAFSCPVLKICCDNLSGACNLNYGSAACPTGSTQGSGNACTAGTPSDSCSVFKICCDNLSGACNLNYGSASCPSGTTLGSGVTCSAGTPSDSCPVTKICCDNVSGACSLNFGGLICPSGTIQGSGLTCSAGTPSDSCPVTKICCNRLTGECTLNYGSVICPSPTVNGTGTTCSPGAPSDSCPPLLVCCNTTTAVCTVLYGSTCGTTGLGSTGTGNACGPTTCDFVRGGCCGQDGVCMVSASADCLALANPGTFLGANIACPAGMCYGEKEPNSLGKYSALNNATPGLASGDSIAGVASGANFDANNNPNGSSSNAFVDMWLVKTAAATPGIYRHQIAQIRGATTQDWTIRGIGQAAGAPTTGNWNLQQSISGAARMLVWYGFGKQEEVILETASGSSATPYIYVLTDTVVSPTVASGTLAAGPVTIRVINLGGTVIDSDTWLYDSNFNALPNDASGPGGADGLTAAGDPVGTTTSFTRALAPGTYYLAVSPQNLANNLANDPIENITANAAGQKFVHDYPNSLTCSVMNSSVSYSASVQLVDSASTTIDTPSIDWTPNWSGHINFVQFTVGGGASGVCCRGATCSTAYADATACAGALDSVSGTVLSAFVASSGTCNTPVTTPGMLGNTTGPCCYANYNHNATLEVQDIFDFLNDWFAGKKATLVGGDGDTGTLTVQNIFDFLNAWFAGGCA